MVCMTHRWREMDSNCRFRSETNSRINAARKAIGDSGEEQKLIRTIARRGFRFIGAVRTQSKGDGPADAVVSPRDELRAQSRRLADAAANHRRNGARCGNGADRNCPAEGM